MAKVFLDANVFIDIVEKRKAISFDDFKNHELYLSPLSIHILTYLYNYQVPVKKAESWKNYFNFVVFGKEITNSALKTRRTRGVLRIIF